MNIERTIEFILENQARAEVRMEKAEIRAEEREKKLDRRMDAVTKLVQQGMKAIVETQGQLKELAQAQKETERTLKAFIAGSRNGKSGRNGH